MVKLNLCYGLCVRTYGSFTMETILATAFGRVIDIQRGESDELTRAVDSIFRGLEEGGSLDRNIIISLISKLQFMEVASQQEYV